MEIENILEELNRKRKSRPLVQNNVLIDIIRRLRKGWWRVLLIITTCLLASWLLYFPLSKIHKTETKMGVMFNKEREANSNGNVSNEIVGRITGWTTTTNKYDEMAILTSHTVVEGMLRNTRMLDSVYEQHIKEIGYKLSSADSVKFLNAYVESFLKRVEVTYTQTKANIKTSIITLSMSGNEDECGPILIGLVKSYNQYTRAYNNQQYDSTLHFLIHCIDSLKRDLDELDNYDRNFREENLIVNFSQQTEKFLSIDRTMEDDLRNINLQIQLLSIIRNYMIDMGKDYKVVPANTGIDDAQINRIVIQFNDLVMRRSNFLTSMGEDAMRVQTITNQIEDQREALIISIDKLTQSFNIRKAKYEQDLKASDERLQKMPNKRITLDQIERERNIKTPLYKLMQQKYTETLIAKSAEQDQARIVTYPYIEETKLFDSPKNLYLLGLLLGILLSILYFWRMKLPPHQMTLEEALQECELPCWSVMPKIGNKQLYHNALEALLARIRISRAKIIAITCSYIEEEQGILAEQLDNLLDKQGENHQLLKWSSDDPKLLSKYIKNYDKSRGYLLIDCGSYHSNPEMPLISQLVDITLWNVVMRISKLKSIDFINYAIKEGIVKEGALVLTDARIDKNNQVNFGTFDYKTSNFDLSYLFESDNSDDKVKTSSVIKSTFLEESDVKNDESPSSEQPIAQNAEENKSIHILSEIKEKFWKFLKKCWWLILLLIVIPVGFMGGYYLTNIIGKTQSNDNNAAKQEIKEVIPQKTSENIAIKKQVPVNKKSLVDDTSKDSKVIDKSKSDVTEPNQSSMADIHEKYAAMDKRVQYGAYKIVGLDKEVQMREGDNLESFSKRYLGPGMSCYIEVFNGIKADTPLKTGQTLKIPKLVKKIKQNI